jgi:regulator of protease activity HflC (stomatin/prohibitin superfamily)
MSEYGISIVNVNIENIDFTDAYTAAVEAKQVAVQNKLQAETDQAKDTMVKEADAKRTIISANADAEKVKIDAEASAAVKKVQADADLYAAQKAAEASKYAMEKEAEGNEKLAKSITPALTAYLYAQRWNGVLPATLFGEGTSAFPMLNMDSTGNE